MNQKRIWAPWRQAYITSTHAPGTRDCLFCQKGRSKLDAKNFVVKRGAHGFSLLNLFPYSNGHMMVAPYRHVGHLSRLSKTEWLDLLELANDAMERLGQGLKPHGYNVGLNFGRVAGAGIPGHLHLHIVPRWKGDTNFMPIFSGTKVISQSLDAAYRLLVRRGPLRKKRRKR